MPLRLHASAVGLAAALAFLAPACSSGGDGEGGDDHWESDASSPYVVIQDRDAGVDAGEDASLPPMDDGGVGPGGEDGGLDAGEWDGGEMPFDSGVEEDHSPTIQSVAPSRGPVSGGTVLTLKGKGFYKGFAGGATGAASSTRVLLGGAEASGITVINDLSLMAVVPPSASAGQVDVTLENPVGSAVCQGCFTYYEPMTAGDLSPDEGSVSGGQWVRILGTGLLGDVRVFFGGVSAGGVQVAEDGHSLSALTPPGAAPGQVDVEVFGQGGVVTLPGAFRYLDALELSAANPWVLPPSGGRVALVGKGLGTVASLSLDGEDVPFQAAVDGGLSFDAPARASGSSATVSVKNGAGEVASLPGRIHWSDGAVPEATEDSPGFAAFGLYPDHGRPEGGQKVTVLGAGLSSVASLQMDGADLSSDGFAVSSDGASISFDAPPCEPGADLDLRLEDGEGRAVVLKDAFRCHVQVLSVIPESGAAGDQVTVKGRGFLEGRSHRVRMGTVDAEAVTLDEETLSVAVPEGMGVVDVTAFDVLFPQASGTLPKAFSYHEELALFAITPSSGTVAGGDRVTIYGSGFSKDTSVRVGGALLKDLEVLDGAHATGRIPVGTAGEADVTAISEGKTATLPGAYLYTEPGNATGGSSGPAIAGTLSVITAKSSVERLGGVTVSVFAQGALLARGTTDSAGLATLQSPLMNRPVQVVFRKDGYRTMVVEGQSSGNLTVFMTQIYSGSSSSGTSGGADASIGVTPGGVSVTQGTVELPVDQIPSGSTAAGGGTSNPTFEVGTETPVISGTVTGFKLPRELRDGEIPMAKVSVAPKSFYSLPPFYAGNSESVRDMLGERWRVTSDGGPFTIYGEQGQQTVYAVFGIHDSYTGAFTPLLMGVVRGVSALPSSPATGVDIRLTVHLDASLEASVLAPGLPEEAYLAPSNAVYAWLSLGNDGYIPFGPASATGTDAAVLDGLPRLSLGNFLFLNEALAATGASNGWCFHRSEGDMAEGVAIGPMVGQLVPEPPDEAAAALVPDDEAGIVWKVYPFDGVLRWSFASGTAPDIQRLYVQFTRGADGGREYVEAILPGDRTWLDLSGLLSVPVDPAKDSLQVSSSGMRAPRFDYDFWSYSHFSTSSLSCWTNDEWAPKLREAVLPEQEETEGDAVGKAAGKGLRP